MLLVLFACLLAAASLLAFEVATGRTAPEAGLARWAWAAVYALAACAGGTLLVALPLAEWVLLIALIPLTTITLIRFAALSRLRGWRMISLVSVVVLAGVAAGVSQIPVPLTRAHIQAALPGAPAPSAHPDAGRLVRT